MTNRLIDRAKDESGFSLQELIIVALIVGMVAAVGLPGFVCQKQKADDSNSQAITRSAAAAMEAYATDNLGAYDGATGTILHGIVPTVPASMEVTAYANCSGDSGTTCYVVKSPPNPSSGNRFWLTKKTNGELRSDCSSHEIGGCPADGRWSAE